MYSLLMLSMLDSGPAHTHKPAGGMKQLPPSGLLGHQLHLQCSAAMQRVVRCTQPKLVCRIKQRSHLGTSHKPRWLQDYGIQPSGCCTQAKVSAGLLITAIWALPQAALHLRACMRSRTAGERAGPLAEQLDEASGSVPAQQLTEAAEAAMQVSCPTCPW